LYDKAIQQPVTNINAYFYLGIIHEKKKDYKRSIQLFKQCLLYDTEHFGACIHLATLLANAGETQKAAKYFKHALKLVPNNIQANFGLGKILHSTSENIDAPI
jgi:tetratricopeptide (TPR) repeat protein